MRKSLVFAAQRNAEVTSISHHRRPLIYMQTLSIIKHQLNSTTHLILIMFWLMLFSYHTCINARVKSSHFHSHSHFHPHACPFYRSLHHHDRSEHIFRKYEMPKWTKWFFFTRWCRWKRIIWTHILWIMCLPSKMFTIETILFYLNGLPGLTFERKRERQKLRYNSYF